MIDPRRWILVETWLALGLRVEWCPRYASEDVASSEWQRDDEDGRSFYYAGKRVWIVRDERRGIAAGGPWTAPTFGTETLSHELAHYLAATPDQRERRNFGADATSENDALETEAVIDAVVGAAARIAGLALKGRS